MLDAQRTLFRKDEVDLASVPFGQTPRFVIDRPDTRGVFVLEHPYIKAFEWLLSVAYEKGSRGLLPELHLSLRRLGENLEAISHLLCMKQRWYFMPIPL